MSQADPVQIFRHRDQLGREVAIPHPPQRIISTVPSQTELLFDLGLDDQIKGITKFCIRPIGKCREKLKIGGTKKLNLEKMAELRPDLILANKEENVESQIMELAGKFPVWISDVHDLDSALQMIASVGAITGRKTAALDLSAEIRRRFNLLVAPAASVPPVSVAYLVWKRPYMVAASGTFVDDIIQKAGWTNAFGDLRRYPEITPEMIHQRKPDSLLLSSEPFPFSEKHLPEFRRLLPGAVIQLVDGQMFSWYGSRLLQAPGYIMNLRRGIGDA